MTESINALDPLYTALISNILDYERQPLARLEAQRDSLNILRGVYLDLNTKLGDLQKITQSLTSTDPFSVLTLGRSTSVTHAYNDATILTASATSTATPGDYEVEVTQLAQAQRRASAVQSSATLALGLTGDFWLGGTGTAGASVTPTTSISGAGTTAVGANQTELGTGSYSVEFRDNEGQLQFRLKDVDGEIVSIKEVDGDGTSYSTGWQDVTAGTYDTGRGLTIDLTGSGTSTTSIDYTAAGLAITAEASDSLQDIATKINDADQPEGREIAATVVGTQLVLTAAHTGTAHTMIYDDQIGLGFTDTDLQTALDAEFLVNDLSFSRSSNTGISDVVIGLTLNFAPDAEGKVATLTVEKDTESLRGTIDTFLESFNSLQTYIQDKTSVEQTGDGIYTRGSLSNDFIFSDLRSNLFSSFISDYTTTGSFASLRELGITIDDNLNATITDSAALEDALENNLDDVAALLDQVMGDVDSTLDRFTGADGYLDGAVDTFDDQLSDISTDITEMDLRLESREESLIFQYGQLQAQLINLNYMQQQWAGIYNRTNTNTFI